MQKTCRDRRHTHTHKIIHATADLIFSFFRCNKFSLELINLPQLRNVRKKTAHQDLPIVTEGRSNPLKQADKEHIKLLSREKHRSLTVAQHHSRLLKSQEERKKKLRKGCKLSGRERTSCTLQPAVCAITHLSASRLMHSPPLHAAPLSLHPSSMSPLPPSPSLSLRRRRL